MNLAPALQDALEKATYAKVACKLIPLLFLGYFVAYLDRVNVGFAKLQMAGDLALSRGLSSELAEALRR